MRNAASSDGEYFPSSMAFTVWRVTLIFSANSCCVISPCSKRRRLISLRITPISGPTPVLDDLAGGAQDLGCHENEEQGVRVEDDWRIERAEKAGERDARRQSSVGDSHGPELDQFVAFVARRLRFFGGEDGDGNCEDDLQDHERKDGHQQAAEVEAA